jgi:hypothetical protein
MKFTINNNKIIYLVFIILVIFVAYRFLNYKEGITNIPICNILNETQCSNNPRYCSWERLIQLCTNKHNCTHINNQTDCNKQTYCNWNNSTNVCLNK